MIKLMCDQDINYDFLFSVENCIACKMHHHFDSAFLLDSHLSSPPKSQSSKGPVLLILKTASSTSHPFPEILPGAMSLEQFLSSVCLCALVHHDIKQECKTVHTQLVAIYNMFYHKQIVFLCVHYCGP